MSRSASLVLLYTVGVLSGFFLVLGAYWDASWHLLGLVENFFSPPHIVLYSSIAAITITGAIGLVIRERNFGGEARDRYLLNGLVIALVGGCVQLFGGSFDFWWHSHYGFDPFLFTPAHLPLVLGGLIGGIGLTTGSLKLFQSWRTGLIQYSQKWLQLQVLLVLVSLWLGLNMVVYMVIDLDGIAYTFQLPEALTEQNFQVFFLAGAILLSMTGTAVMFAARAILRFRGAMSATSLVYGFASGSVNLLFRAWILSDGKVPGTPVRSLSHFVTSFREIGSFVPLHFAFLAPILLIDILLRDSCARWVRILALAVVGVFGSYLDGYLSLVLWTRFSWLVPILFFPILAGGIVALLVQDTLMTRLPNMPLRRLKRVG